MHSEAGVAPPVAVEDMSAPIGWLHVSEASGGAGATISPGGGGLIGGNGGGGEGRGGGNITVRAAAAAPETQRRRRPPPATAFNSLTRASILSCRPRGKTCGVRQNWRMQGAPASTQVPNPLLHRTWLLLHLLALPRQIPRCERNHLLPLRPRAHPRPPRGKMRPCGNQVVALGGAQRLKIGHETQVGQRERTADDLLLGLVD